MASVRVVTSTQQGLEENVIRPDRRSTLQVPASRHVPEYVHRADQLPGSREVEDDRVVEVLVADVANGEHLVHDVVHLLVHFRGAELPDGDVVGAVPVFESRLLRCPVEEVETHQRVFLECDCVGELFRGESWREARDRFLKLGFVEDRFGVVSFADSPSKRARWDFG